MKITGVLFTLLLVFLWTASVSGQTPIVFSKGVTEKTLKVTIEPHDLKTFSLRLKKGQVANFGAEGDIQISKTEEFPVIGFSLSNGVEGVDNSQDGEAYISILAGRTGKYVISINNSDRTRSRTFQLKVKLSNNKADFLGGEEVK